MTRSKVIGGQIVIVILVNLFQILFEQVRFNYNQTWIIYRYNKGAQWENCYSYELPFFNLHVMTLFEVT